jgi:acetylornithine deacetylase/succinyl-diaminopimelate desuccinylase-like protein
MFDFFRIPSVSSLPEHASDVRRAGEWVMARMQAAGIENVEMLETGDKFPAHPIVYGDWLHAPGKPTVMIYGHFDVQPVDPIDLWDSPPFEPVIKQGKVYARGSNDDKGNMLVPILAVEALLNSGGKLPVNVKFFLEGQEEIGSPTVTSAVQAHAAKFACDMVISADGGQWSETQPELAIGLRGLCAMQINVTGPNRDVHSGMYGGAIQNPIHALIRLLDSMRSPEGKILVAGFYDDVRPLSEQERQQITAIPYQEEEYKATLALNDLFGEPGYSTRQRIWARPTLEVNGIWGGFQGAGSKTVIPSTAHAKITCRLVADQDPAKVLETLKEHIATHTPPGVSVTLDISASASKPYLMPADHPGNLAARDVHLDLYDQEPFYVRSGGSIPVCALFHEVLGVYTVNFGFALPDERQHSPNEFWRLASFDRGQQAYCMLLERLGE